MARSFAQSTQAPCPHCGQPISLEVWLIVDLAERPELRAAFDLHRFALYEALRLPVPRGPEGEEAYGQRLSEYLFRGTAQPCRSFVAPGKP